MRTESRSAWISRVSLLSGAVVLASSLTVVAPSATAPAAASTTQAAKPTPVSSAPNVASAMKAAAAQGSSVTIDDSLATDSSTKANPDGSLTLEQDLGPVRERQADGSWANVDLSWQLKDGKVTERVPAVPVTLSPGGDADLASAVVSGVTAKVGWDATLPTPTLDGSVATYANVRPGVDLVVEALRTGFEVRFVIHSRPPGPLSLPLGLTLTGGSASQTAQGLTVVNGHGVQVGQGAKPVMFDATKEPGTTLPARQQVVASSLSSPVAADGSEPAGSTTQTWDLSPDQSFLSDPATVFPVTVDPSYTFTETSDTYVKSNVTTSQYSATRLYIGLDGSGNIARTYLHLSAVPSQLTGYFVENAQLRLFNTYSATCDASQAPVRVYQMTSSSSFNSSTVWTTRPAPSTARSWSANWVHAGPGGACGTSAYDTVDISSMVRDWVSGANTNRDMQVSSTETDVHGWKEFTSIDNGSGIPAIVTTYYAYPTVPTSADAEPKLGTGPSSYWVNTLTPQLSAYVSSPSGDGVRGHFYLYAGSTAVWDAFSSSHAGSGRAIVNVPSTAGLNTSTNYTERVWGASGGAVSATWSDYIQFQIDTAAPTTPSVSSTQYPNAVWSPGAGNGTFSFSSTDARSGVDHYLYGLDTPTPNQALAAGTSSVTLSPTPDGWHTLSVAAVDRAGNVSTPASYSFGSNAAVTSPADGAVTNHSVTLASQTKPVTSGSATVSYYYRRSSADSWAPIPSGDVTVTSTGPTFSGWPYTYAASGDTGVPPQLTWNTANTLGNVNGPAQVAVCFGTSCPSTSSSTLPSGSSTQPSNLTLDALGFNVAETQDVTPGSVNLLTGNFQLSGTDASVPGNQDNTLSVGRTFNTMQATATLTNGIFGPGWSASLPVDAADADWAGLSDTGPVLLATASDQSTVAFQTTGTTGLYAPTGADSDSGLTVKTNTADCATGYACYELDDLDGNQVVFQSTVTSPGTATLSSPVAYTVVKVVQPGSADTTTYTYSSGLVTRIVSPVPSGATCTDQSAAATWTAGCRGLALTYSSGKLTAVTYLTSDGTNPLLVDVACYDYDSNGRLADEWDPRDIPTAASGTHPIVCGTPVRPTHYTYDSAGRVQTVTPAWASSSAPVAGWTMAYASSSDPTVNGRLVSVTRTHLSGYASGSEVTSVLYGVPVTADGSNPSYRPDMTSTTTATWAQTDNPDPTVGATAVCPPGASVPSTASGDLTDCSLSYLDAEGRAVNTAAYSGTGAAGWHITTTERDTLGHVVRTLDAVNREVALAPTTGAGAVLGLPSATGQAAMDLSAVSVYTPNSRDAQPDQTASYGPYHQVQLANGTLANARLYTATVYDNSTGDTLATGTPTPNEPGHPLDAFSQVTSYHLPVIATTSASQSADAVPTSLADSRTSQTRYYNGTDYTGWTYRTPLQTITDPAGLAITSTTVLEAGTGRTKYSRMPSAVTDTGNGTAGTTRTFYYSAGSGAGGSGDAACDNKPLWDGMVCKTLPMNLTPTTGLPSLITTQVASYDYLGRTLETDETSTTDTTHSRATSTTYGFNSSLTGTAPSVTSANPYATTAEQTALTGGVGTAVPAQTVTYATDTGLQTSTSNGTIADATGYDDFGRAISYSENTSASGGQANATTATYDPTHGWVTQTQDAHTTTTLTHNGGTEHRGLVTSQAVAVNSSTAYSGTFTASYDASGSLTSQTDPNSVTTALTRDEAGQLVSRVDDNGGADDYLSDTVSRSINGQWLSNVDDAGDQQYTYDAAGRLTQTLDTPAGGTCTTRSYAYTGTAGADSNRTSSVSYPAASDGSCQTTTGSITTSHSYDTADRLLSAGGDTGVTYDTYGRITNVPSADVTGGAAVAPNYYANDLVRSQSQTVSSVTTTQTWTLDAVGRLGVWTTTGGTTANKTNHYDDASSDSPDWIAEVSDGTQWTANITDLIGGLALIVDQTGAATYQYANVHGDIAGTAAAGATAPTISPDYGEFGTQTGANSRYAWLGGKQRSDEDLGGLSLMGVRLYDPTLGRFLQRDPVVGGSANEYDYSAQDPINNRDIGGDSYGLGDLQSAGPENIGNFKKLSDAKLKKLAEEFGYDSVHEMKEDLIEGPGSHWDAVRSKVTGRLGWMDKAHTVVRDFFNGHVIARGEGRPPTPGSRGSGRGRATPEEGEGEGLVRGMGSGSFAYHEKEG